MAKKNRKNAKRNADIPTPAELAAKAAAEKAPPKHPSTRGGRETIDALAVAVVLALLIRTFQAEAFVIPTGSMAPTLMGKHKDVYCDQCGQRFKVNASDEDGEQLQLAFERGQISRHAAKRKLPEYQTVAGVCPQCRYTQPIRTDGLERYLSGGVDAVSTKSTYSGDRLVVNKYHYSFFDPERWDIAVFKYPGKAQTNYIKRIVGLPGEELRIVGGDLMVRDGDEYVIAERPPDVLLTMSQHVHDTDRDPARLHAAGWPLRWSGDDAWSVETSENGKNLPQRYAADASGDDGAEHWLRYRHTPAGEPIWKKVLAGGAELNVRPKPSLVTDYIAYNSRILRQQVKNAQEYTGRPASEPELSRVGLHWVGDLMLEADVEIESSEGDLLLELVEAGDGFGCRIDVATGEAEFYRRAFGSANREPLGSTETKIRGAGAHTVRFANYDDRLLLWVDGRLVDADIKYEGGAAPEDRAARVPRTSEDDAGDLAPARIGVRGAKVALGRLQLKRDTYYIADSWVRDNRSFVTDLDLGAFRDRGRHVWRELLQALPVRPEDWDLLAERRHVDFELGEDQFFVMGDNSPESLDARLWFGGAGRDPGRPGGSYLERDKLVGKAVCVYWPHAWYSIPVGRFGVPIVPNLPDMRLVR